MLRLLILATLVAMAVAIIVEPVCFPWEVNSFTKECRAGPSSLTVGQEVAWTFQHTASQGGINVDMQGSLRIKMLQATPVSATLQVTVDNTGSSGNCGGAVWGLATIMSVGLTMNPVPSADGTISNSRFNDWHVVDSFLGYQSTNLCIAAADNGKCAGGNVQQGVFAGSSETATFTLPFATFLGELTIGCPVLKWQSCLGSYEISGCEGCVCGQCEVCSEGACVPAETEECCCDACGHKTNPACAESTCTPVECGACAHCEAGQCVQDQTAECCCDACGHANNAGCNAGVCTPVQCGGCTACDAGECVQVQSVECCCDACGNKANPACDDAVCTPVECGACATCEAGQCVQVQSEACCCDTCGNLDAACDGAAVTCPANPCTEECTVCVPYATGHVCEVLEGCCCDACGVNVGTSACADVTCTPVECDATCETCDAGECVPKADAPYECCCDPATGSPLPDTQCLTPDCTCCDACGNRVNPACDESACTPVECGACATCEAGQCVQTQSEECCCDACGVKTNPACDDGVCTLTVCGACRECNAGTGECVLTQSEECCCDACGHKTNAACDDAVCTPKECGACETCEAGQCVHTESAECCCDACGHKTNPACDDATCTPVQCGACRSCVKGQCADEASVECCCDACGVKGESPACGGVTCPSPSCDACEECVPDPAAAFGYECRATAECECAQPCVDASGMFGAAAACNLYANHVYASGGDTWGRICVAGTATLTSFGTATRLTSSETLPVLIVGDALALTDSTVVSPPGGVYGNTYTGVNVAGSVVQHADIEALMPFSTLTPALAALSHSLLALPANGQADVGVDGTLTLRGCDAVANVWDIDACGFNPQRLQVVWDIPAGSLGVMNVRGACATATLGGFDMVADAELQGRLVWNFDALDVLLHNVGWKGSVLAMHSAVHSLNAQVEGSVFADLYDQDQSAEIHLPTFVQPCAIPCDWVGDVCAAPPQEECTLAQCGGAGYTGPTTCCTGYTCVAENEWYSQCKFAYQCSAGTCASLYGQCGGEGFTGPSTCQDGAVCVEQNQWFHQCELITP